MASYRIEWRSSTKKDLKKIPSEHRMRIIDAVERLAKNPFPAGSEKLSGSDRTFRIRVGDFRVVYEVYKSLTLIIILRARHRKEVYR
jgi:mRNA interferase RelE/StbE